MTRLIVYDRLFPGGNPPLFLRFLIGKSRVSRFMMVVQTLPIHKNCSQSPCLYMSYEATYALKCSLFKKIVKNQFFALRVHKKQFLANISKTERFSMYVASYHLYECDHCAHFGVFEKSLRPSGAELAFLPNCAKRAWPP